MKKFLIALLPLAMLAAVSCSKYDDSELKQRIDDLDARLTTLTTQVNSQISELRSLIAALQDKDYVEKVETTTSSDGLAGWIITFTKSDPITIYTGTKGQDAPVIGVQEVDGVYYWTLTKDGKTDFLLDAKGNKIQASAVDGVTPVISIEKTADKDHWFATYGDTKVDLGVVSADITGVLFKEVVTDEDNAKFMLWDGTVITMPLAKPVVKLQILFDESPVLTVAAGEAVDIPYTLVVPEGVTATISTFETGGWQAYIIPLTETTGNIHIIAPDPKEDGKILISVTGDDGSSYVRVISAPAAPSISVVNSLISVSSNGGSLSLEVLSNVNYIVSIPEDVTWIHEGAIKGMISVDSSNEYDERTAVITLKNGDGTVTTNVTLTQKQRDAIVLTSNTIDSDPQEQDIVIVVSDNIGSAFDFESDSDWATIIKGTKALVAENYTISLTENTGDANRTAKISFSAKDANGEDINEVLTITQYKYRSEGSVGFEDYNTGSWKW